MATPMNLLFRKTCEKDDIKCKATAFIALTGGASALVAYIVLFLRNYLTDFDNPFMDLGRLLIIAIVYFGAYLIFQLNYKTLAKLILIYSALFTLLYFPVFFNYDGYDLYVLYPIFIFLLGAFAQLIFYFQKEIVYYFIVMLSLILALVFTDDIYYLSFQTIDLREDWGRDYFVIELAYFIVFFTISGILYFVLRKYREAQSLQLRLSRKMIKKNHLIIQKNTALSTKNTELKDLKTELDQQNEELQAYIEEVSSQRDQIASRNQEIIQSITYAQKIQSALIPKGKNIYSFFDDFFVLNKPKDILSGDFLWTTQYEGKIIVAVADCTGHGVPAALLSVLGISALNEIVLAHQNLHPNQILNYLREKVVVALSQSDGDELTKDGMDISLLMFDKQTLMLEYAGAYNPLVIIRDNQIISFDGDRMPVGVFEAEKQFSNHEIQVQKEDLIYLFSDGYVDQFGGAKNKKMKRKHFKELLVKVYTLPLPAQKERFAMFFSEWKGNEEQVDDVLILGLKV